MTEGGPFLVATPRSHHAGKRHLLPSILNPLGDDDQFIASSDEPLAADSLSYCRLPELSSGRRSSNRRRAGVSASTHAELLIFSGARRASFELSDDDPAAISSPWGKSYAARTACHIFAVSEWPSNPRSSNTVTTSGNRNGGPSIVPLTLSPQPIAATAITAPAPSASRRRN
jgi:hypothetical protein